MTDMLTQAGANYGFFFDQEICTGCKACQIACKDKHDLPRRSKLAPGSRILGWFVAAKRQCCHPEHIHVLHINCVQSL